MAKEKLKVRKKKSGGLRPEERSKGVEGKKTVKNMAMDTGLCCNFCVVYSVFLALNASLKNTSFFLWTDFKKIKCNKEMRKKNPPPSTPLNFPHSPAKAKS